MLRTKRSPLKSTGDSGNHLDVTNEGLEGFPPAQKKNSSFGGPPTSSGLPVPVTRAVPVIPNENKVNINFIKGSWFVCLVPWVVINKVVIMSTRTRYKYF